MLITILITIKLTGHRTKSRSVFRFLGNGHQLYYSKKQWEGRHFPQRYAHLMEAGWMVGDVAGVSPLWERDIWEPPWHKCSTVQVWTDFDLVICQTLDAMKLLHLATIHMPVKTYQCIHLYENLQTKYYWTSYWVLSMLINVCSTLRIRF